MKNVAGARARCATVLGAAVLAAGLLSGPGAGPAAAATCSGSSCTGKNPNVYGCDADAVTKRYWLEPEGAEVHKFEERFSRKCRAVWVRVRNGSAGYGNASGRIQSKRKPKGESSFITVTYSKTLTDAGTSFTYMAPMTLNETASSRMCWDWGTNAPSSYECSSWASYS